MSVRIAEWCLETQADAGTSTKACILLPVATGQIQWFERMPPGRLGPRIPTHGRSFPILLIGFEGFRDSFILFLREPTGSDTDPLRLMTDNSITFLLAEGDSEPIAAFDSPVEEGFWDDLRQRIASHPPWAVREYDEAVRGFFSTPIDVADLWEPGGGSVVVLSSEDDLKTNERRLRAAGQGGLFEALWQSLRQRKQRQLLKQMLGGNRAV